MRYTFSIAEDAEPFNRLANLPALKPFVSQRGDGELDLSPAWQSCVGVLWQEGGFVFQRMDDCGMFEVHTMFEDGHGAKEKAAQAVHFMFTHGCDLLTTRVPDGCPHARRFAKAMGMREVFRVEGAWEGRRGSEGLTVLHWNVEDWIAGCESLEGGGRRIGPVTRSDGPIALRYLGFLEACYANGAPARGIHFYNRWAKSCGETLALPVSENVVMFGDTEVTVWQPQQ